jgi:hypothetical protein
MGEFLTQGTATISFSSNNINILSGQNADFGQGPWTKEVKDCSSYLPGEPMIGMKIIFATSTKILNLYSSNHFACTYNSFASELLPWYLYNLRFNYQVLAGDYAQYYYKFTNNDNRKVLEKLEKIQSIDKQQHEHSQLLSPENTYKDLSFYFYAPSSGDESIVEYSNLRINKVAPKNISKMYFKKTKIQKKDNHIQFQQNEVRGRQTKLIFKKISDSFVIYQKDKGNIELFIHGGNTRHQPIESKINNRFTAWYINPSEICGLKGNLKEGCTINPDGSYDIELIIEFTPQRWFYVGLIISGTTLLGCLIYLGYDVVRSRRFKKDKVVIG